MNTNRKAMATKEGQLVLETLQRAVKQTLENKKRLGQYAVTWHDGKPVVRGEDAPKDIAKTVTSDSTPSLT